MEGQAVPVRRTVRRRITAPIVVLTLLVALAGFAAYAVTTMRPWDAATYVPRDAAMAVTVDLAPTPEKMGAYKFIEALVTQAGVKNPQAELLKSINDELGINLEKELLPKLNGKGAFAMIPIAPNKEPGIICVVGTRTSADANSLLATAKSKLSKEKLKIISFTYQGFKCYKLAAPAVKSSKKIKYVPQPDYNFIGAVGSALIYANSLEALKKTIDTASGKPSLAGNQYFAQMRSTNGSTVATAFYSGANLYKLTQADNEGMAMMGMDKTAKAQMENVLAMVGNLDAGEDGLKFACKVVTKRPVPQVANKNIGDLVSAVPKDAALVMTIADFDKFWVDLKQQIMDSNPQIKQMLEMGAMQMQKTYDIDPFADFLDRITKFTVFYIPGPQTTPDEFPGSVTFAFGVDKPDVVNTTVDKLITLAEKSKVGTVKQQTVADQSVQILTPEFTDSLGIAEAMVDNQLTLVLGQKGLQQGLESSITTAAGKSPSLAESASFTAVMSRLPGAGVMAGYGDTGAIVKYINDIKGKDRKTADMVLAHVGRFGFTSQVQGTETEATLVLPFNK